MAWKNADDKRKVTSVNVSKKKDQSIVVTVNGTLSVEEST
jgi:hypothetical protein